jgi:hypothetical protein
LFFGDLGSWLSAQRKSETRCKAVGFAFLNKSLAIAENFAVSKSNA